MHIVIQPEDEDLRLIDLFSESLEAFNGMDDLDCTEYLVPLR
jgi:hypothetical protein